MNRELEEGFIFVRPASGISSSLTAPNTSSVHAAPQNRRPRAWVLAAHFRRPQGNSIQAIGAMVNPRRLLNPVAAVPVSGLILQFAQVRFVDGSLHQPLISQLAVDGDGCI